MTAASAPRLRRLAAGVDFDGASLAALSWAASALAPDAALLLVHAVESSAPATVAAPPPSPPAAETEAALAEARARLRAVGDALPGRAVEVDARPGAAARVIATAAEEWGAELIVVGPHGGDASTTRRLGSTAERLVRISPIDVLMVDAPPDSTPRRLLVPVDYVDLTPAVLERAYGVAQRTGAEVTLLHVVEGDAPANEARRWLEGMTEELGRAAPTRAEVASGTPGEAIVAAAERDAADLVVLGRRGRGRALPGVLGSTVSVVLRGAPCPVLVVVDPRDAIVDVEG